MPHSYPPHPVVRVDVDLTTGHAHVTASHSLDEPIAEALEDLVVQLHRGDLTAAYEDLQVIAGGLQPSAHVYVHVANGPSIPARRAA